MSEIDLRPFGMSEEELASALVEGVVSIDQLREEEADILRYKSASSGAAMETGGPPPAAPPSPRAPAWTPPPFTSFMSSEGRAVYERLGKGHAR